MRRRLAARLWGVVLAALVLALTATTGVGAQDSGPPDFGEGWVHRLQEPLGSWSTVAGSADTGFVVRGLDGGAYWSPDGLSWQAITDAIGTGQMFDLTANDTGFVAVSGDVLPSSSALYSPDGRSWEVVAVGASADFWRVESGDAGFFLVSGCDFVVMFSADGREWVPAEIPAGCGRFLTAATSDGWVGLGNRDDDVLVLSSNDGVGWREVDAQAPLPELPSATSWPGYAATLRGASLSSDGETLVLAGRDVGGPWVSMDRGVTWTDTGKENSEVAMTVGDFGFVGVAPQRVLASPDGVSWVPYSVDMTFQDAAAVGSTLVATADDGIYTWTPPRGSLPVTGTEVTPVLVAAGLLVVAGMIMLHVRRLQASS